MRWYVPIIVCGAVGACAGGDPSVEPGADAGLTNSAPVARAGDDRVVLAPSHLVLDGSGSHDPDGDALTYRWRLITSPVGSQAALADLAAVDPELVVELPGVYEISLVVSDGTLSSTADVVRVTATGGAPVANAGSDRAVHWGTAVELDGGASVDPQGDPLVYTWAFVARPPGSSATLSAATTATPTFVADRVGRYDVQLTVGDGGATSTDTVTVMSTNGDPQARAGVDQTTMPGTVLTLDGSASTDPDGDPITFSWTVVSAPAGSTALPSSPAAAITSFTPVVAGAYVLRLTVSDGAGSGSDTVALAVDAAGPVVVLPHDVVDAEYSNALDALVMVSSTTQALHILRPATGMHSMVPLPLAPVAVSISPSGTEAVVAHNAWISVVDLSTATRTAVWSHTADPIDVVHGGNGWAYVLPRIDQWTQIRSVRLDNGVQSLGAGTIRAGSVGRLSPTRPSLYLADRGLSPADIEHHDTSMGNARLLRDSPYHGDYSMCGNLWMSDDGNRIYTACGNVFRASPDPGTDMTYNGSIGNFGVGFVDHSDEANLVAVLPRNGFQEQNADTVVRFFEEVFLGPAGQVMLPPILIGNTSVSNHGRFVFWNSAGTRYHVIMRATPPAGAVRDTLWTGTPPS